MPSGALEAVQHPWIRSITAKIGCRVQNLKVNVRGKDVILTGLAGSYHAKQLAQESVLRARLAGRVENHIVVVTDSVDR